MNILVVVAYFLDLFQADLELVILRHKDEKCRDMDGNIKFLTHNLNIHVPRLTDYFEFRTPTTLIFAHEKFL